MKTRPAWAIVVAIAIVVLHVSAAAAAGRPAAVARFALADRVVGHSLPELRAQRRYSLDVVHFFHRHRRLAVTSRGRQELAAHRWLASVAERRIVELGPLATAPRWLVDDFVCIHEHEGAWPDNPSNTSSIYWGGLQFGWDEWSTYGGQYAPTADLATPAQQIAAAIAYWRVAGFAPWPVSAPECGL